MRIARVKFTTGGRLYDYILKDKRIKAGDVVYVDGNSAPVYVYEVKEMPSKEVTTSLYVLSKAIENKNVHLASRYMNIIDCKCECIVNSLGTDTHIFGAICESIVENAKSLEIDNMLKFHPHEDVFFTYITDAGLLPSKHILHIVMPYKVDDPFNKELRKAFEIVIDKAIEMGYSTLAIPFIGTGANGYSKEDVHEALDDTMFKYQYMPGIKITIVSVSYNPNRLDRREFYLKEKRKNSNLSNEANRHRITFDIFDKPKNQMANVNLMISKLYDPEDEFDISDVVKPIDFIDLYRRKVGYKETSAITYCFGTYEGYKRYEDSKSKVPTKYNDTIKNIRNGKRAVSKLEVFRMAIALKLNFTRTIQLMSVFDYSFSPISEKNIDFEVFNFMIHNNGFENVLDITEVEEYFYFDDKIHELLFGSNEYIFY